MASADYSSFFGRDVFALTSDATINFHKGDPAVSNQFALTREQKAWLKAHNVPCESGIAFPKQVHGDVIWSADNKSLPEAGRFEADAVTTNALGLPIAVRTADCLSILIFDPVRKVVAAVHAGWRSTHVNIVQKTIRLLERQWNVEPSNLKVAFGPCIRLMSYEVGEEFRSFFPDDVVTREGRIFLDLASANRRQILAAGVDVKNIFDCALDTFTDQSLFSFRRDGEKSGRMLSVIMMK